MNRWLETDTQKTARSIINALNESAAGMVKKEINKDKPEEAPKEEKVALEKRVTKAVIKGKKPESKNAKMPEKTAKKVVKEIDNKIMNESEERKDKEERLASLKTQLEKDKDQLAADEIEAIEKEIADLEAELFEKEKLNEAGEWDDNDEDMQLWLEGMRDSAEELAKEVNGEVKTVKGFDAYQGPFAIVSTPKHGDIEVWYDQEDDSGLSFNAKVAHVGWISGGIIQLAELLNLDEIPEDEIINESEKLNEKINHANDDINRAIANPNLGKNRDKIHAAGYEVTDYGLIKNPKTKKRIDPSQYSREEKKKVDFKGMLDSERKNNQGKFYPEYVPKGLKTGAGRGYAQADRDDMEAQNGISQNIKDYKDAVKTRDENRRWAERNRKNIPHYEKKVKDAQKDLEFQKNYTDKLEKDADRMENKRKEILNKARATAKKESLEQNEEDGWGEDVLEICEPFFEKVERTMYEVRNARRGSYAHFGDTVSDLAAWMGELSTEAEDVQSELDDMKEQLQESDNEPKTVKEYRIMDGNKVLKTFSADERSKGYAEMRAMGKALRDAGKEDNLIYKEFTVKNKLKEEYSEKCLNEEDTFEELIPEEDEDVEKMYDVISYYDDKLKGIEDSITSNDWSVITDFAHNKLMNGSYVKIVNTVSGKEKVITPSTYQDEFNGEFTIKPEGLTEAEDVQSELDDMKEQLQESDKNKLKEEYSEKFGGDPKDFIGDLISVKHQLSKLNLDGFGSHLARQMVEDFIDTCDRQIKKAKRLASGDEFYTEADDRTYKDRDEAEYYRNKELYANSNLARHREAMEKAKKACEEKGIKLDEDNYLSRTRKQEPLDLVAYEPEITSVDEVKDKYVKIRGDFHKVIDVKPEGDKFVISFAAGTGTAIGGEFEPATLDEIKRLQLYTENK